MASVCGRLAALSAALFALGGIGCSDRNSAAYDVPEKTAEALRTEIAAACVEAVERDHPMLVEFSAPWCSDCQRLSAMKQAPALARELAGWPRVVINVRQFDLHADLLATFGVEQIAHWAVLAPSDCREPIEGWPRLAQRKLEPYSGAERDTTPADLASWLAGFR